MKQLLFVFIILGCITGCKKKESLIGPDTNVRHAADYPVFLKGDYGYLVNNGDDSIRITYLSIEGVFGSWRDGHQDFTHPAIYVASKDTFRYDLHLLVPIPLFSADSIQKINYDILDHWFKNRDGAQVFTTLTCKWNRP